MRQSLACQSMACHFLTAFPVFFGPKIDIYKFRGHFKNDFFTKLGKETIIFGQNQDFAVSI